MSYRLRFLIAATGLLCSTCKNPLSDLPQPSETGQNTFGCLINGNSYVPDGGGGWSGIKPVYGGFQGGIYSPYSTGVGISVRAYSSDKRRLSLFLNDYRLGMHPLDKDPGTIPAALYAALGPRDYGSYDSSEGESYATSAKHIGWINVSKADTATGIVSGTFEFEAATLDGKTVRITKGRFDVNHRNR